MSGMDSEAKTRAGALIATRESDRKLAEREREAGAKARRERRGEESCPWSEGSMTRGWWMEGHRDPLRARDAKSLAS